MASASQECLQKFRQDRIAREKARIEKLRELNLKKYSKEDVKQPKSSNINKSEVSKKSVIEPVKNLNTNPSKPSMVNKQKSAINKNPKNFNPRPKTIEGKNNTVKNTGAADVKPATQQNKPPMVHSRKSIMMTATSKTNGPTDLRRKTLQPQKPSQIVPRHPNSESVFERLYKPKQAPKISISEVERVKTDPNYLKKVIKDSNAIFNNRRRTVHEAKVVVPVRRSISAVHFKRISKNELPNCIHKWSSVGEKLNMQHLAEANEDENVEQEKVISAIKCERKKVKFQITLPYNFNTPKPEELQAKLKSWLQKRGKNLDSFHHLQCFGIHHFSQREIKVPPPQFNGDDENKENVALESDSDDDSYSEIMADKQLVDNAMDQWRSASCVSESIELNDSRETTMSSDGAHHHVDELLLGALNDLTELLREGFEWEQCARWLRALHERFSQAPETAAYWECRAALEERRGDLPASVQCWEEAIVKGTKQSVVEANLDQLLHKFMKLEISPNSGNKKKADPKMIDIKNVFKSTIIRFAVQQAKIRNSMQSEVKFTVTPVRRSNRLTGKCTPLRLCSSVRQATKGPHTLFQNNPHLAITP